MTGEEILLELAGELSMLVNPGQLPDEDHSVPLSMLIEAIRRTAGRVGYREWEDRMGDDL